MTSASAETRIVLVDDAGAVRSVLRMLLKNAGHRVVGEFSSGHHLLQAIDALRPDIVCLDLNLPGANGLSLLQALHTAHPEVAVVVITGSISAEVQKKAVEAGAAGFIRKPFSESGIVTELGHVAHAQNMLRRNRQQETAGPPQSRQACAVIADDSSAMRRLLAEILSQTGIDVVGEALNGKQAVELAALHQPDIVCLDLTMPVMDGLDALQTIRSQNPLTKIVIVTASAQRELIHQAAGLGASAYILKPYQPEKIVEMIDRLLDGQSRTISPSGAAKTGDASQRN